ncbi:MAG: hypothetical protein ACRER5_16140 [Pseudomonas sp.]
MSKNAFDINIGDQAVALRKRGSRHLRTANILGREVDAEGVERIWLDRIVLAPYESIDEAAGWGFTGAVSTVLYRIPERVHQV